LATWEDENGEVDQEWEDYVIFAYENAQLINNINKAIKQLKANGYIDNLASTWLGQDQDKVDNNFNQSGSGVIIIDGTTSKQNYGFGN
jgi:ABC-type amino acid transport substrate-binding protein